MKNRLRAAFAVGMIVIIAAVVLPTSASAADTVTVAGQSRVLDGTNVRRLTNYLVMYTQDFGTRTGTNSFGYEASVVNGKVTVAQDGVGNMTIPVGGVVLSGHGTARTFLKTYAKVGASVTLPGATVPPPPPGAKQLLPDLGVRTLRQFTIVNTGGKKLLKFPGVTANVGDGPFEIHGTRTTTNATNWAATQTIYNSDGSKTTIPSTGVNFYFAGDGHNHWHIRDLDSYELFNAAGTRLATGEKHGFCFEDNTSYRDWPGSAAHPASPGVGAYQPSNVCGVAQPNAVSIMHGLSVGWSDTYPSTLPDQAIDITGIPNGTYRVQITADWDNWIKEKNEVNNTSAASITISGTTVTLNSTSGGL